MLYFLKRTLSRIIFKQNVNLFYFRPIIFISLIYISKHICNKTHTTNSRTFRFDVSNN